MRLKPAIEKLLRERYHPTGENSWDQLSERVGFIHKPAIHLIKQMKFMPGSPFLMNANTNGLRVGTLSSCFPIGISDSMEDIFESIKEVALVTKASGGIGIDYSCLRSSQEPVKSADGRPSSGPLPFINIVDATLDGVRQGSCVTRDTLINTTEGLQYIDEIIKNKKQGWNSHNKDIITEQGIKKSKQYYYKSKDSIIRLGLSNGQDIKATPNHKLKVLGKDGYCWKSVKDLKKGEWLISSLNIYSGNTQYLQALDTSNYHFNCKIPTFPNKLTKDIAFLLGYLYGNGYVSSGKKDYRVGFIIRKDSFLINWIPKLFKELFNLKLSILKDKSDQILNYTVNNKILKDFLILNGIAKSRSKTAKVPLKIRQSPRDVVASFIQGYFEADGYVSHGFPSVSSASYQMLKEVSILLYGLVAQIRFTK